MLTAKRLLLMTCLAPLMMFLAACSDESAPVKGFVLPQGDVDRGLAVFTDYKCYRCHTVADHEFPALEFEPPFLLNLGGEVYRVSDYGELLTAVVNPSHIISPRYINLQKQAGREVSESPMPDFSDDMTVSEMVDLVEFLHAQYSKLEPKYYRGYYLTK